MQLSDLLRKMLSNGDSRLQEPLANKEIDILTIIDAVGSQSCIRVRNYNPDTKNKHLSHISLGPSYLESQLNRAIKEILKKNLINPKIASYLRTEIGLEPPEQKKPEQIARTIQPLRR